MSGNQVYQALGGQGIVTSPFPPIMSPRNPTTSDIVSPNGSPYSLLQEWINTLTRNTFIYTGSGIWVQQSNSTGTLLTLTDTANTSVTPTAGNIKLSGTTNQITVTAGSSTITFSLPTTLTAPGSVTVTTNLTLSGVASKILINASAAATASIGVSAAMSGSPGVVTVTTSAVTTASVILYSRKTTGGTPGEVSITAQPAGSFTLTSTGNETSTFNYLIIN